jgi:hypothetical protein
MFGVKRQHANRVRQIDLRSFEKVQKAVKNRVAAMESCPYHKSNPHVLMVDSLAPICREKMRIRSFHPASSSRTCTSCAGALVPQTIDRPLARSVSNPINETETGCLPHQFRPRNNRHEHLRLCMKIIENTLFLPRLRGFLPLITVWLEVRVLPGPPPSLGV